MTGETRAWLAAQADPAYRAFQHKLMPGVENYLGVGRAGGGESARPRG